MSASTLFAAAVLAVVHLFAGKLRFLEGIPRSRWLSASSGVSVAYVFVHLLPELSERQEALREAAEGVVPFIERHVYLVALLGLAVFYGLELLARRSRTHTCDACGEDGTSDAVFSLHTASYATYNALIGYVLVHGIEKSSESLVLFTIAIALHFVVNDYGLREHHKDAYTEIGRWVLAAALLLGWLVGVATEISEAAIAVLLAFLAGGVVLNVLKEELPEERKSRFSAFAIGATAYAALLLTI